MDSTNITRFGKPCTTGDKEADLIRDNRQGKYVYYELNVSVLKEIMLWITELKGEFDND